MELMLPSKIRSRLKRLMLYAGNREIGGILMGEEIGEERFRIVDFSVDTKTGSSAHFVRDAKHHEQELQAFFQRTGQDYSRFNYLGEWHTHPQFSVQPSFQDIRSMQDLVDGSRGVDFSVLLIARLKWFMSIDCSASLFIKYEQLNDVSIIMEY